MKPVNILLLVLAGALGGAVIMKVAQPARSRGRVAAVVATGDAEKLPPPQLAQAADTPGPAVADATPAVRPSPFPETYEPEPAPTPAAVRNEMKPRHPVMQRTVPPPIVARMTPQIITRRDPVPVAQAQPPAQTAPQPANVPAPQSAPPATPEPAPVTNAPPARMQPENQTPVPAPQSLAPTPHTVTLNAGLLLPVRLVDSLSSDRNQAGDRFTASLDHELVVDGLVIAERGARVEGQVVTADRGTKVKGNALLSLEVTAIFTSDDQYIPVQTDAFRKRAEPDHTADAEKIGGGVVVGAVIGAIAGGGKGAAIGAGVGGGAGAGDVMLTRKPAALASETRISFRLRAPVAITEKLQ